MGLNPRTIVMMNYKPSANSAVHPSEVGKSVPRIFVLEFQFWGHKRQVHISCTLPYSQPASTNKYACLLEWDVDLRENCYTELEVVGSSPAHFHSHKLIRLLKQLPICFMNSRQKSKNILAIEIICEIKNDPQRTRTPRPQDPYSRALPLRFILTN